MYRISGYQAYFSSIWSTAMWYLANCNYPDRWSDIQPISGRKTRYFITRKRALHTQMSHSTVCNTTISTKKIRHTLMKLVRQLRVTPHACKKNAPVNVKEKYLFVLAIKRGHGMDVCMCVCHH